MALLIERNTLLTWRIIQFCLLLMMLILEIAQLVGYHYYYWDQPANDQIQIWISEAISFAIIGYILVHFNNRWKNGPYKEEMVLDWILFTTWSLQCYLNMGPILFGKGLNCSIKTNKYNITTSGGQARCHLFIGDIILSYFIFFTTIATLTMSVLRWKNRKLIKPSLTCDKLKSPYLIEKGLLSNGEPVLFFYSRNMHPNSINSYKLRNSMVRTSESSPLSSPVNIEIPEPELAATSARVNDFEILAPKDSQK